MDFNQNLACSRRVATDRQKASETCEEAPLEIHVKEIAAVLGRALQTKHGRSAMTLAEVMVAATVGSTVLAAGTTFFVQSMRSCAAIANYYDMDNSSRSALSWITREIREADKLIFFSPTQMQFQITDPNTLAVSYPLYTYDPVSQTLTRTVGGESKVMLKGCQHWTTTFYQRTPIGGTYDE